MFRFFFFLLKFFAQFIFLPVCIRFMWYRVCVCVCVEGLVHWCFVHIGQFCLWIFWFWISLSNWNVVNVITSMYGCNYHYQMVWINILVTIDIRYLTLFVLFFFIVVIIKCQITIVMRHRHTKNVNQNLNNNHHHHHHLIIYLALLIIHTHTHTINRWYQSVDRNFSTYQI